jgi:hypothetical protein
VEPDRPCHKCGDHPLCQLRNTLCRQRKRSRWRNNGIILKLYYENKHLPRPLGPIFRSGTSSRTKPAETILLSFLLSAGFSSSATVLPSFSTTDIFASGWILGSRCNPKSFASDPTALGIPSSWHASDTCVSHPLLLRMPRETSPELTLAGRRLASACSSFIEYTDPAGGTARTHRAPTPSKRTSMRISTPSDSENARSTAKDTRTVPSKGDSVSTGGSRKMINGQ